MTKINDLRELKDYQEPQMMDYQEPQMMNYQAT